MDAKGRTCAPGHFEVEEWRRIHREMGAPRRSQAGRDRCV